MAMKVRAKLLANYWKSINATYVVDVTGSKTTGSGRNDNLASVKHKQVAS